MRGRLEPRGRRWGGGRVRGSGFGNNCWSQAGAGVGANGELLRGSRNALADFGKLGRVEPVASRRCENRPWQLRN